MLKYFKFIFPVFLFFLTFACKSDHNKNIATTDIIQVDSVKVIYFHYSRRCATCNAIETTTKEALKKYGEKVSFEDVNLDTKEGKTMGKQFNLSGQTLLIIAGKATENITNEAFLYARSSPDKLNEVIQSKIEIYLK